MKKSVLLINALFVLFTVSAQAAVNAPFYKIEKNGQVAYLLGTIHIGVNYSDLNDSIKNAAAAANTIILETDLDQAGPLIAKAFPMGPENSLKDQLTQAEWDKLYTQIMTVPGTALAASFIDQLHPAMASSMYQASYLPETAEPIDQYLFHMSKQPGKAFQYFEEGEIQINALAKTSTVASLKQMLAAPIDQLKMSMDFMVQTYEAGNEAMMKMMFIDSMSPEDLQVMLIDRNNNWVNDFDGHFNTPGTEFIAVGAAHLLSDIGLVHQLQLKGYTLTPITQ